MQFEEQVPVDPVSSVPESVDPFFPSSTAITCRQAGQTPSIRCLDTAELSSPTIC